MQYPTKIHDPDRKTHFKIVRGQRISYQKVSPELRDLLLKLHMLLEREFKSDFAYVVRGRSRLLAASNVEHGRVLPDGWYGEPQKLNK